MNESKKNIEINSILKAILKREYPSYISKNFSSQIMDKIYKTSFRNNIYSHTLRIASAVTFAAVALFLMESFFVDKVKYSKTTIDYEIITPTKNVTNQVDDCDKVNDNIKSSDKLECK